MKMIERKPTSDSTPSQFDVAHDLPKTLTTCINHKEAPQRSDYCSSCNPKQEVALFLAQRPLPNPCYRLFHTYMDEIRK